MKTAQLFYPKTNKEAARFLHEVIDLHSSHKFKKAFGSMSQVMQPLGKKTTSLDPDKQQRLYGNFIKRMQLEQNIPHIISKNYQLINSKGRPARRQQQVIVSQKFLKMQEQRRKEEFYLTNTVAKRDKLIVGSKQNDQKLLPKLAKEMEVEDSTVTYGNKFLKKLQNRQRLKSQQGIRMSMHQIRTSSRSNEMLFAAA